LEIANKPPSQKEVVSFKDNEEKVTYEPFEKSNKQQKYEVRERSYPVQTEIKWNTPTASVETETLERPTRQIPVILEDNANIDELENTPAYVRKKKKIENQTFGIEKEMSKYTLVSDKENIIRLRDNNSYLYDKAD